MKKLTLKNAKRYALEKFKVLPNLHYLWNILHSEMLIETLKLLIKKEPSDRLKALAWVHDIGKIISEEDHAKMSMKILQNEFELDEIDKDCILNHGSSSKPKTPLGGLFYCADGLSLFLPKSITFKFYAESKENKNFDEIQLNIEQLYQKYKIKYSDYNDAVFLLEKLFKNITNP